MLVPLDEGIVNLERWTFSNGYQIAIIIYGMFIRTTAKYFIRFHLSVSIVTEIREFPNDDAIAIRLQPMDYSVTKSIKFRDYQVTFAT